MQRIGLGFLILVVLLGVIFWGVMRSGEDEIAVETRPAPTSTTRLAVANLEVITNDVDWRASDAYAWQDANLVSSLIEGDQLEISGTGEALLTFGATSLEIFAYSRVDIQTLRENGQLVLAVEEGYLVNSVISGVNYELITPVTTLQSQAGVFTVQITEAGQTHVAVSDGQVEVNVGLESMVVVAGNQLTVEAGGILGASQPLPSPTPLPSATPSPTLTSTPTTTLTFTPTFTPSPSPTVLPSATLPPTQPTSTRRPTEAITPTATLTLSPTPTTSLTPTQTPSITLTATPTGLICVGKVLAQGGLFIRRDPQPDGEPIAALAFGEEVTLIGQSQTGNWYKVTTPMLTETGWMASNLLETTDDCRINMPTVE